MRKIVFYMLIFLCGCVSVNIPDEFSYRVIKADNFDIATWQKITNPNARYKIYIEGDGYAFNAHGLPTSDPTPRGTFMRELAFGDTSANVIYVARPCQYVKSDICAKRHWTTARFAPEIISAEYEVIKKIANDNEVILIGFSGGAQIAGLVATAKTGLNIKKIITVAGNLDHLAWTRYHQLPNLDESMSLESYRSSFIKIPQRHYVGSDDDVIPPFLVRDFIKNDDLITEVKGATHTSGFDGVFKQIWQE